MTDDLQHPKPGDKDEKGRPVLLRYKFGFNPCKETFVYQMTGIPHAVMTLDEAGLLEPGETMEIGSVLSVMVRQAVQDRDPARFSQWEQEVNRRKRERKAEGKDEDDDDRVDNYLWFCGAEPWMGTPERICHWFRVRNSERELEEKEKGGPEPLPTHIHGDGSCKMMDDGEGGEFCIVQSREDEEKHRAELKREREKEVDPVHIADCIAKLERFGLIVPVGTDYRPEYPPYPDENEDSLLETPASKRPLTLRNVNVKEGEEKSTLRKRTVTLLNQQTIKELQEGGINPDYIRFLGSLSGCAGALNGSANPVKAANTMIARGWFKGQFKAWIKNHPAD